MVFDKLINPKFLRTNPIYAAPIGMLFVLLGFITSLLIFPSATSVVMVSISSLLILPYVVKIFEFDELDVEIDDTNREELGRWVRKCLRDGFTPKQIKDNLIRDNIEKPYDLMYDLAGVDEEYLRHMRASNVFSRHKSTIIFYISLFAGMFAMYILLYGLLTPNILEIVFRNQLEVITPGPGGHFSQPAIFREIVANNLKIMMICVLLSLFYGSGAIFILNYNASIAGVLYGSSLRTVIGIGTGLLVNPLAYIPHTTLEILAYLFAAISGGILSKATVGGQPSKRLLLRDGGLLFLMSLILVFVAGYIEVIAIT